MEDKIFFFVAFFLFLESASQPLSEIVSCSLVVNNEKKPSEKKKTKHFKPNGWPDDFVTQSYGRLDDVGFDLFLFSGNQQVTSRQGRGFAIQYKWLHTCAALLVGVQTRRPTSPQYSEVPRCI